MVDYTKFYTPPEIASVLINKIRIPAPAKIIDICCGSCNLLNAARKRWRNSILYGVDLVNHNTDDVIFEKNDGREFALKHPNEYELVLANPPFDYLEKKGQYPDLFRGVFSNYKSSRLEIEMMLANLIMLKENGTLMIIMPSSFVEGETHSQIRSIIAQQYQIKSIIELDENTFGASHISSYALEIRNSHSNYYRTKLMRAKKIKDTYVLDVYFEKTKKDLVTGNWIGNYSEPSNMCIDIKRGNISSAMFSESGKKVLHTSKYHDNWSPSLRYTNIARPTMIYAETGDIIVSRIGKSAGQWTVYSGEKVLISDCLFRIKDPNGILCKKIQGKKFNLKLRGVATRYITMADFKKWIDSL